MAAGDAARLYHALSSYDRARHDAVRDWPTPVDHPLVLRDFVDNDRPTFPAQHKRYRDGLPAVDLPRTWDTSDRRASEALAGVRVPGAASPDLASLARVLFRSAGVVRIATRRDGRRFHFRSAPSAGGRFPLELYVAARGVDGLSDAVHWYDPLAHRLVEIGPAGEGDATTIVVTGIPWRTGWRYAERGLRHIYWDAGTMLAQTMVVADDAGLRPRLRTRFPDAGVSTLVGVDGIQEFPIAIVTFGEGEPAVTPGGPAEPGSIDRDPVEFPLVTLTQHAGDAQALGEPWPEAPELDVPAASSVALEDLMERRTSTREFDPRGVAPREALIWPLAAAMRGSRTEHIVVVHAVEGVQPGLYRWPDVDVAERPGDLRDVLFRICYDQELGRDAAYDVIGVVDLAGIDDRGYREALLDAGIVSGRLCQAAQAMGLGATGMTFLDGDLPELLDESTAGLLVTCVGLPAHAAWHSGTPGKPTVLPPPA
jgi:SagB-type dehydrogenase family enzyme